MPGSTAGSLAWGVQFAQRPFQITLQCHEIADGGGVFAANQDIIPAGGAKGWENSAGHFAHPAFGAVAGNGVANFFWNR